MENIKRMCMSLSVQQSPAPFIVKSLLLSWFTGHNDYKIDDVFLDSAVFGVSVVGVVFVVFIVFGVFVGSDMSFCDYAPIKICVFLVFLVSFSGIFWISFSSSYI